MSHVATVELEIKDIDALEIAAKELGLELMRNQKTYRWYGRWVQDYHGNDAAYKHGIKPENYGKCEHALRIKGDTSGYEIGVARNEAGQLQLIWDFYGSGQRLVEKIGKDAGKLTQLYACEVATKQAKKQGFAVQKKVLANGKLQLVCRR
jgi:hypothetical protein